MVSSATVVSPVLAGTGLPAGLSAGGSLSSLSVVMSGHASTVPAPRPFGMYPMGENEGAPGYGFHGSTLNVEKAIKRTGGKA